jgi:hypothetical protein
LNTPLKFATYTYVFLAPTTSRIIRQVGLMKTSQSFYPQALNSLWTQQVVFSATELTSPIEQTAGETFEVVYKYQFSEVTP